MTSNKELKVNIDAFDIVFSNSIIKVETERPIDARSAEEALSLSGKHIRAKLSRDGKSITLGEDRPLTPGNHELIIDEIKDREGKQIGSKCVIPFTVVDSIAKVPKELSIKSFVRLQPEALQTKKLSSFKRPKKPYIEMMKAVNRETGAPVALAFDEQGRRIKAAAVFEEIESNRAKKFGRVHETLFHQLNGAKPNTKIPVAIWMDTPSQPLERKKEKGKTETLPRLAASTRRRHMELLHKLSTVINREFDTKAEADTLAPVIYAELTPEQIRSIAKHEEVVGVFLHETTGIDDLEDSIAIAQTDDVHTLGFRGTNINVAVWEDGPHDLTNLTIAAFYDTDQDNTSAHATLTNAIIRNNERSRPHGHAPNCRLHSANNKKLDALRWAVENRGCTVISQSFHRSSEPGSSGLSFDDLYKDYLALNWPYPTIIQAAGNYWSTDPDDIDPPEDEYVNHKGYNSLAVGNHNDDASGMSGSSVFRNPSSPYGDRELPEICANGTGVSAVGEFESGTSFAAPAVAGATALLQNASSTLESWPEGCRAILLAGASINVDGKTWWGDITGDVDAADGAGALDSLESLRITQNRRSRNASATRRGWDVGVLRSSDIGRNDETEFSYLITVPRILLNPKVKVALAWNSKVQSYVIPFINQRVITSKLTLDLDINIYDGSGALVGYSGSWDNSYEIAEFNARRGQTYTIKIRRWSGTDDTWYGIAWTVRGISFVTEPGPVIRENG